MAPPEAEPQAGYGVQTRPVPTIRRARTPDVRAIREIVAPMATDRRIVAKDAVTYYEAVHEFRVAELDGAVVGCGALHVMWEDLAEVRTLAVAPALPRPRRRVRPAGRPARRRARRSGSSGCSA